MLRAFVLSLLASKTVLFIGFSFNDINLKYILREIQTVLCREISIKANGTLSGLCISKPSALGGLTLGHGSGVRYTGSEEKRGNWYMGIDKHLIV